LLQQNRQALIADTIYRGLRPTLDGWLPTKHNFTKFGDPKITNYYDMLLRTKSKSKTNLLRNIDADFNM
jgi:hypothetical protein